MIGVGGGGCKIGKNQTLNFKEQLKAQLMMSQPGGVPPQATSMEHTGGGGRGIGGGEQQSQVFDLRNIGKYNMYIYIY